MQELCSALLLKVSKTMPPEEPGGPSPPVTLGGIIRTNGSGLSLKISIFLILIARQDDQVEILEISDTNNTNEDFYKESLLAISKIGDPIIDSLFYSLCKLKKTGVKSVAMNLVNNSI
ncbi:hypothetical protein GLOIN_2v1484557 [Rhizophagus irregularis DAOM 181602=DAOM 197198]|uniref:Uncharacterized protein n=1 Tax=Rhizophagus irregularis (strain DAOM 181602 / DAOM 197198 / MUCL 43194) TaxID=747089 RepID=A0A2P4PDW5_RHIID|nr:hypothetical protein GLOIN_2v1484557 [Rhizophagus irregularis DAOM 181602=DAOM 197198]POG63570.1 hypothetical protein GLOIN_2v1484557 [Rhizophagus irregularis DAOM 181602=DAOM 197198]|eukprot:XP_025170436.1 hypothetical protein GLOIN_2v1484557 [Rhizophagus irregularis DAOM 181602=DAOM 197198]